jgi:hypothetical protein
LTRDISKSRAAAFHRMATAAMNVEMFGHWRRFDAK